MTLRHNRRMSWRNLPLNLVRQLLLNSAIALILWRGSNNHRLDIQMVYSQAIGLTIWGVINVGALLIDRDSPTGWPRGGKGAALVATGIVVGCLIGTLIGDAYSGLNSWRAAWSSGDSALFIFGLTLIVGVTISYVYFISGRSAYYQAELEQTRRQATEAQLKLLQSQLEPHMLFNTLANLRALIGVDPAAAQQMLDRLNAFLRATLSASRATLHPLAAEFERLHDYLELMAIRMGTRLSYRLDLPPELAELSLPPLLLQPLVENAIQHGLEPQREGGRIEVSAARVAEQLVLTVHDSGVGFDADAAALRAGRFGMTQVRERVASAYGGRGALTVHSQPGAGTTVQIRLPCSPPPA